MLEELRSLGDARKKQVIIISTIIIMLIVIGIWVTYFNSIIVGSSAQNVDQSSSTVATAPVQIAITPATSSAQASGPGLWQDIKNVFGWFGSLFSRPSQYKIQPK